MARKYNLDGSYSIRNSEGETRIFPDGKKFYMNMAGQKALQEYYKSNAFNRVQTGTTTRREKYYTGPPKAGGQGWQTKKVTTPTYGYLPSKPFQAVAPKPKPAPTQPSYKPQPIEGLVSAKLDEVIKAVSAPKPEPAPPPAPPKILFSGSTPLTASPLQIGPANPRSLVGGTSKFKRQGGVNSQLKINQSVNV